MKILIGYPPTESDKGIFNFRRDKKRVIALGEIIGTIPGDGCFMLNKSRLWDYTLACKDKELIERMAKNFFILFWIKINIHKRKGGLWYIRTSNKKFIKFLDYLERKNNFWIFTKKVVGSDSTLKNSVIRGFSDCEGTATCCIKDKSFFSRRIALYNSNKILLLQIQKMLKNIGINSVIKLDRMPRRAFIKDKEYQFKETYSLRITNYYNLKLFYKNIGFNIPRKMIRLKEMINSYKRINRIYFLEDYKNVINSYTKIKNCKELSRTLNLPAQTVQNWILKGVKPRSMKK